MKQAQPRQINKKYQQKTTTPTQVMFCLNSDRNAFVPVSLLDLCFRIDTQDSSSPPLLDKTL